MRRTISVAAAVVLVAALAVAVAQATNPPDVRVVAGSMPGFPHAVAQRYGMRPLTAAQRAVFTRRFNRIRIGAAAGVTVSRMGRVHKVLRYTQAGNLCDYFDGGFVVCIAGGRVAAKGYETAY